MDLQDTLRLFYSHPFQVNMCLEASKCFKTTFSRQVVKKTRRKEVPVDQAADSTVLQHIALRYGTLLLEKKTRKTQEINVLSAL